MRSKDFAGMACSTAFVLDALGDRWGLIIMRDLILGLARYEDLRKSTGVTNATLTDRLRRLEANGLVERRRYQERPERFEYVPSAKGRDIGLVVHALMQVGDRWKKDAGGPPLLALDRRTGHGVRLALFDVETGERVSGRDIVMVAGPGSDETGRRRLRLAASSASRALADAGSSSQSV